MARSHPMNSPRPKLHLVASFNRDTPALCGSKGRLLRRTQNEREVTCQRCLAALRERNAHEVEEAARTFRRTKRGTTTNAEAFLKLWR